jgi:hypothetical protein
MVWRYLLGLSGRLERLILRWKAGTLPRPRAPRPAGASTQARDREAPRTPPCFPLPRGREWLPRHLPGSGIGVFGGQLRHLLANNAEMRAFLEASPQARRLLAPLCRAFGIDMNNPLVIPPARPAARPRPPAEQAAIPPPWPHPAPPTAPPPVPYPSRGTAPATHPAVAFLRR